MAKHTPGPWKPFGFKNEPVYCGPAELVGSAHREHTERDWANARLISAAPELAAALARLLELADDGDSGQGEADTETALQAGRDVLAKAGWEA